MIFCSDKAEIRRRRSHDDTVMSFHLAGTTRPFRSAGPAAAAAPSSIGCCGRCAARTWPPSKSEIDRTLVPQSRGIDRLAAGGPDRNRARTLRGEERGGGVARPGPFGRRGDRAGGPLRSPGLRLPELAAFQAGTDLSRRRRQRLGHSRDPGDRPAPWPAAPTSPTGRSSLSPSPAKSGDSGAAATMSTSRGAPGPDRGHGQPGHGRPLARR